MKKRIFVIFLIVLSVLMLSANINVHAESGGYSLLVRKGEVIESFSTSEVTSEAKSIFDNKVSFNNSFIKVNGISVDRFSVTDAQGALLGPINFTITGDNTFKVLSISSCSLSVSGSGTLKFVPSAFGEEGIITDVEQQKVFVSSRIKTSLPVSYEDGYVYINKKIEEAPSKEPEKETTNQNSNVVNKDESTNKEEIKDTNVVNKNENNTVVNDNSDKNSSQSTKPSNGNKNEDKKDDKTDEVINDDVDNKVVTSDDSEQEIDKNEDINAGTDSSNEIENINDNEENKKNNIPLYVAIGTIGAVGAAGAGMFIVKKRR